jgi:branched-chain amino acid transport system substrate-binding protein
MTETKYKQFKIVASVGYPHETSDVVAEILTLKKANPDVVYGMPYISDAILFTKAFKEVGFNPKVGYFFDDAGVVEPQYLETVGKEAEFFCSRGIYNADLRTRKPSLGKIEDLYHKRYGTNMTDNSARAMLKALVLFDAINRAKSAKPDDIRKALLEADIPEAKTNMVYGVKFDPNTHQNVRTQGVGIVQQVRDKVYRVVYPWDFASVDLVWPIPTWDKKK